MAENLNRPEDFLLRREHEKDEVAAFLIPPSQFEKPLPANKSEVEIAKKEIQELRELNEKLKLQHSQVQQQIAATSFASSHNEYADELIKRQAGEIAELRQELIRCRDCYEQESAEWQRKCADMEAGHKEEGKNLDREMKFKEEEFERELSRLKSDYERALETAAEENCGLKEKLDSMQSNLVNKRKEFEELEGIKADCQNTIRMLETGIRNKDQCIETLEEQISKQKTYIGDMEQTRRPAQFWQVEKETADNKLRIAQAEHHKLQSELELMSVRFKALEEILAVQEAELSKIKSKHTGAKGKQYDQVLTGWRRKVYELLVQQKSMDIVNRNDVNNLKRKISDLEDQVVSSNAKSDMLENSLKDRSAQLQMEVNDKQRIQEDLQQVQQVAECLDDQSRESSQHLSHLREFMEGHDKKNKELMKALEEKFSSLKAFSQRVTFAANRMEYLKAQFARKTALSMASNVQNESRKSLSVSRVDEDFSRDSEEHLYQELERVMRERDSLATQVREDTHSWSHRLAQSQSQYRNEVTTLKKTVEDLEKDIQQKSKSCYQLTEELETIRETLTEKDDTIAQLQAELARHARGVDAVLTDQHLRDEADYTKRLVDVEKKLNDSKREHAKTVVALRQLERTHSREQQRSQDLLRTTEEHYGRQIQQLQSQLVSVEKDRNVVMATLRQEGLINKLRTDRGEPARLNLEDVETVSLEPSLDRNPNSGAFYTIQSQKINDIDDAMEEDSIDKDKGHSDDSRMSTTAQQNMSYEPVDKVLEDLKSLTAAIFDDDDDYNEDSLGDIMKGNRHDKGDNRHDKGDNLSAGDVVKDNNENR